MLVIVQRVHTGCKIHVTLMFCLGINSEDLVVKPEHFIYLMRLCTDVTFVFYWEVNSEDPM
jgi:hypothetical protein